MMASSAVLALVTSTQSPLPLFAIVNAPPPTDVRCHCWAPVALHMNCWRSVPMVALELGTSRHLELCRATKAYAVPTTGPPQTLTLPPPPHVLGCTQVPQLAIVRIWPQLSLAVTLPQFLPSIEQSAVSDAAVQPASNPASTGPPPA